MRIVVAMSGGVDSSVAAARLAAAGHDVIGLSMQLYDQRGQPQAFGSCCTLDDLHDARRVAHAIGIPHYVLNLEADFERTVVRDFIDEYTRGRTPIPCIHCNADLKFATLVDRAAGFGAAGVATGHYARIQLDDTTGRYRLLRGVDPGKDQSYFLFSLTQDQLAHACFPVGHLTKAEVRAEAARLGLTVADKPDSQEICFVPDGDAAGFVERHSESVPAAGDIVDRSGRVLGRHGGIHRFTVGQRRGLGAPGPAKRYVLRLEPADDRIVVGSREELGETTLVAREVNWIAGRPPAGPLQVTARIRHRHEDAPALVTPGPDGAARVVFDAPQPAITPGQAVVFYQGEDVVGGGWIDR